MLSQEKIEKLKASSTEELLKRIEYSPYRIREHAIGNNELISRTFLILHERKEPNIDCEVAFCFQNHKYD